MVFEDTLPPADTPPPEGPPPTPDVPVEAQFDFAKIAANLHEAGACFQALAARADKNGQTEKAQDLRDRGELNLDEAEFLLTLVGLVTIAT